MENSLISVIELSDITYEEYLYRESLYELILIFDVKNTRDIQTVYEEYFAPDYDYYYDDYTNF